MSDGRFSFSGRWCSCKVLLIKAPGAYPEIVPSMNKIAIGVMFKDGEQFFISQELELTGGEKYILKSYKHKPPTIIYERILE